MLSVMLPTRLRRWAKAVVLLVGSLVALGLGVLRLPDPTTPLPAIAPARLLTAEVGWVDSLAYLWGQGSVSGRDFHFNYGPLAQLIAWLGARLSVTGSPFDAFPLALLAFLVCSLLVFLLILALLPGLRAWHSLVIYLVLLALQTVILDPLGCRFLIGPLCVVVLARAVATPSPRRRLALAALAGLVGFLGQLITAELGLLAAAVAVISLGGYSLLARSDQLPPRRALSLLAATLGTLGLGNLALSAVYKLTAPAYDGLFDYQWAALAIIRGYNSTLAAPWSLDRFQTAGLAGVGLVVVGYLAVNARRFAPADGYALFGLLVAAVVQFKSAVVRSDTAHIVQGLTPCLLLFLLLVHDWAGLGRRHAAWLAFWLASLALLLRAWPWTDPALAGRLADLLAHPTAPAARFQYFASLATPPSRVMPYGLLPPDSPAPVLVFPYENHLALAVGRPLVAPILQVYAAHTPALQRRYVEMLDRQPATLAVVYGLDNIASVALDGVQHVTRAPIIFEYLHRHFELATGQSFGGFYRLRRRAQPAELEAAPVPVTTGPGEPGGLVVAAREPGQCSLLRLRLTIRYPPTALLGRPNPLQVRALLGQTEVAATRLVALDAEGVFTTYLSLMDDYRFAEVFGPGGAQVKAWDRLVVTPVATGLFGVSPREVAVSQVECITVPATGGPPPGAGPPPPDTVPPLYEGYLDRVECGVGVVGWLWDVNRPAGAVEVAVLVDGRPVATLAADEFRPDLVERGKGTGRYQFRWPLPATLRDGRPHQVQLRVAGSPHNLNPQPVTLTCPGP